MVRALCRLPVEITWRRSPLREAPLHRHLAFVSQSGEPPTRATLRHAASTSSTSAIVNVATSTIARTATS